MSFADKIGLTTALPSDPIAILAPTVPEGATNTTPPTALDRLAHIPHELHDLTRAVTDLARITKEAHEKHAIANSSVTDTAQDGADPATHAYLLVTPERNTHNTGIVLSGVLVGVSAAGVVRIVAAKGTALLGQATRTLATVRATVNTLSVPVPSDLYVDPGEHVFLVFHGGATANFDFSCEWRLMRGM